MKKFNKTLYSILLTLTLLLGTVSPIMAAGSPSKPGTSHVTTKNNETDDEDYAIGDSNADSRSTSSSFSNKFVGSMYYQSSYYQGKNKKAFTIDSEYTVGMTDEEEEAYYQSIFLSTYEDADREIITPKWDKVENPIVEIINNLNEDKITYQEAIQKTIALNNEELSFDEIVDDLIKDMFKAYKDTMDEKGIKEIDVDLNEYVMLSDVQDLILYDANGKQIHGSNIQATLSNSLINENIDPDNLYVLHYNIQLEKWELIPTTNVDTENGTADAVFNNLSPFTFLYKKQGASTTNTTTTTTGCNTWYCKLLKGKFCKYLMINSVCYCWVIIVILALLLLTIIGLIIKSILDNKRADLQEEDDLDDTTDFL